MAWYWLILGCVLSLLLGFFLCAMFFMGSESDDHMESFNNQTMDALLTNGTRAERRRRWRQSWLDMKREV